MTIEQLSIFVENKTGGLAEVTRTLADNNIDMRTLSIAETQDFGVLRAIVDDPPFSVREGGFIRPGYISTVTPVLAVAIDDRPGGLNRVLQVLVDNDINLEYTYAFVTRKSDIAYMVIRVADNDRAIQVLTENGVRLVSAEELFRL